MVVGNYVGSSALTAVGAGFSIMFLISSLFLGFSMGATIMIAQYVGAGDQGAVGRTVDTIYSALLVIIVPLTLLGVLASGPLLTLIRVPQEAYEQARTYCMVVLGGIGIYQPLLDFAGAGASVPLTGFGALLAKGVRDAMAEQGAIGILTGGLTASAGGITTAITAALLGAMLCRSRDKA